MIPSTLTTRRVAAAIFVFLALETAAAEEDGWTLAKSDEIPRRVVKRNVIPHSYRSDYDSYRHPGYPRDGGYVEPRTESRYADQNNYDSSPGETYPLPSPHHDYDDYHRNGPWP